MQTNNNNQSTLTTSDPDPLRAQFARARVNEGVDHIDGMSGIYSCEVDWNINEVDYFVYTEVPDAHGQPVVFVHEDINTALHFAHAVARPVGHDCWCDPCWHLMHGPNLF